MKRQTPVKGSPTLPETTVLLLSGKGPSSYLTPRHKEPLWTRNPRTGVDRGDKPETLRMTTVVVINKKFLFSEKIRNEEEGIGRLGRNDSRNV